MTSEPQTSIAARRGDDEEGYTWETAYEKTWEILREDDEGSLKPSIIENLNLNRRKRLLERQTDSRLGTMRYLSLVLDQSEAMIEKDPMPSRHQVSVKLLRAFIDDFFDQNPISQLGIIIGKDRRVLEITPLSGNAKTHYEALAKLTEQSCSGEFSLQNCLEKSVSYLRHYHSHASKEVLIIVGNLSSCDPDNIYDTIDKLRENNIRCCCISLSAELHIYKQLARLTGGTHAVITDETHFKDLLFSHTLPPPTSTAIESSLVKMGFPGHRVTAGKFSFCICHNQLGHIGKEKPAPTDTGYHCVQCNAKYCTLPVQCKVCNLLLVSAPQLARSYQHISPLGTFDETKLEGKSGSCFACLKELELKSYQCKSCKQQFCLDCDVYLHESLQICPGCLF